MGPKTPLIDPSPLTIDEIRIIMKYEQVFSQISWFLKTTLLSPEWEWYLHFKPVQISIYSRLSLSRNRRDSLKHFEISVLRHIRFAELRKIPMEQTNFTNKHVIWLFQLEIYVENIVEQGRNCSWGAISPLIYNILLPDARFLCENKDQIYSSR